MPSWLPFEPQEETMFRHFETSHEIVVHAQLKKHKIHECIIYWHVGHLGFVLSGGIGQVTVPKPWPSFCPLWSQGTGWHLMCTVCVDVSTRTCSWAQDSLTNTAETRAATGEMSGPTLFSCSDKRSNIFSLRTLPLFVWIYSCSRHRNPQWIIA